MLPRRRRRRCPKAAEEHHQQELSTNHPTSQPTISSAGDGRSDPAAPTSCVHMSIDHPGGTRLSQNETHTILSCKVDQSSGLKGRISTRAKTATKYKTFTIATNRMLAIHERSAKKQLLAIIDRQTEKHM